MSRKREGTHYKPRQKTAWSNPYPLNPGNMGSNYPVIMNSLNFAGQNLMWYKKVDALFSRI